MHINYLVYSQFFTFFGSWIFSSLIHIDTLYCKLHISQLIGTTEDHICVYLSIDYLAWHCCLHEWMEQLVVLCLSNSVYSKAKWRIESHRFGSKLLQKLQQKMWDCVNTGDAYSAEIHRHHQSFNNYVASIHFLSWACVCMLLLILQVQFFGDIEFIHHFSYFQLLH